MTDPIADVLGDYRAIFAGQKDRLRARGIDISPYPLSHLAYRVPEYDQYLHVRGKVSGQSFVVFQTATTRSLSISLSLLR